MNETTTLTVQNKISFRHLLRETIPEMWLFQLCATALLSGVSAVLLLLIDKVAAYGGTALTTANLSNVLYSWRAPVLLGLGILLVFLYIVIEVFALIHFSDDVLSGKPARIRTDVRKALSSLIRLLNPRGLMILLYIFIAIPLGGIGFSISLTNSLYIPNFIMDVIISTPIYLASYLLILILLVAAGFRHFFTLHAILLDGLTTKEALKRSEQIMKAHWRNFLWEMIRLFIRISLIALGVYMLFRGIPEIALSYNQDQFSSQLLKRFLDVLLVFMSSYLNYTVLVLAGSVTMIYFTVLYRKYSKEEQKEWPERPKKARYRGCILFMILVTSGITLFSFFTAYAFDLIFPSDTSVEIIAHRAGGTMAPENSIAGLNKAIDHGCFGSEIDVQRTRDGYYIINHDDDFSRLAGVSRTPSEMTLKQIQSLSLPDGEHVVTLEEMLDAMKGKEKLFIELKGQTADQQMADDVVQIVKKKQQVDEVVLISLKYNLIDYVESTYPEFETGVLCFASIGELSSLNCDNLIIEEEMANFTRILNLHRANKKVFIWTVNSNQSLKRFLSGNADAIITDEVENAVQIRNTLGQRDDLQLLEDMLSTILT